jgi:hypothetical protein
VIVGVHHRRVPDFLAERIGDFPGEAFVTVADVQVEADEELFVLDAAYHLTQHYAAPWTEGDQICCLSARHARSTSVGDILTIGERAYAVLPVGFKRID